MPKLRALGVGLSHASGKIPNKDKCEFTSIVDINLVLYFHNPVALKYMTQGDPLSERVYDYSLDRTECPS